MNTKPLLTALLIALFTASTPAAPSTPLPADLQLVPSDALPADATWWSVSQWNKFPPSPVNWCQGRTDVLYYRSPSLGTNSIIIDDTLVDYDASSSVSVVAGTSGPPMPPGGGGGSGDGGIPGPLNPPFGSNDLWLEIQFDTNAARHVDVVLHGATNGVWQLLTKTNLADTNVAWSVLEIQIDDGTTNTLYFGPYPDDNPSVTFFRAQLATNLFSVVATNLPNAVGIAYHPPRQSLVLPINYSANAPFTFGILDTNAFLTNWSVLSAIEQGYEVRIATVKTSANGLNSGELIFSASQPSITPATVGWLSADGTTANTNWSTIMNEPMLIESLVIDETGVWGNDVLAVAGDDVALFNTNLNVWRIHSRTNVQLVTTIPAKHLEGALTIPNDLLYGPWAAKFLTADEYDRLIYAVSTNGTFTTTSLNIAPDELSIIPTNQDLYCVQFLPNGGNLLKLPRQFLRRYCGDVLIVQAGETGPDPILFIVRWNPGSSRFDIVQAIDLWDWFGFANGFFEKATFAPVNLAPIPQ